MRGEHGQRGSEPRKARRPRHATGKLAVGAIMVLAGVLLTTNARLSSDDERDRDLGTMLTDQSSQLSSLSAQVDALQDQVDGLTDAATTIGGGGTGTIPESVAVASGRAAVQGPGVHIELNDAPASVSGGNFLPDQLVVHQQDIEAVLNALWRAGAEAVTVQGQRMSAVAAVRCVGNVVLIGGAKYSPPYVIEAIGDPNTLRQGVISDPQVELYLEWVDAVGLGWQLTELASIEMPGYLGAQGGLVYAHATASS